MSDSPHARGAFDGGRTEVRRYLERIGLQPETPEADGLETLETVQRAHVESVPFENLAIVGDPYGSREGEGVVLSVPRLYEKIVEDERGGYCFELNGLAHWLLGELGYDVDRIAARMAGADDACGPANHHSNVVESDRRYVVDVGITPPMLRRPVPLDGTPVSDGVGSQWRIVESDRPDATHRVEHRSPGEGSWSNRFVFADEPRELRYFEAVNDHLQSAPESPFTGEPIVATSTGRGHRMLVGDTLTIAVEDDERERVVAPEEFHEVLDGLFGLSC